VPGPVPADVAGKPALMPPASITEIILLGDGDSDRFATEMTLRRARRDGRMPGRHIGIAWAPASADFNDVLRGAA
jgi:hypothetical protein